MVPTIEIFRTDIDCPDKAATLSAAINGLFPHYRINFDLQDCDKILRIVAQTVDQQAVIRLAGSLGMNVEVLPG